MEQGICVDEETMEYEVALGKAKTEAADWQAIAEREQENVKAEQANKRFYERQAAECFDRIAQLEGEKATLRETLERSIRIHQMIIDDELFYCPPLEIAAARQALKGE
jgi:hypothetical protein